MDPKLSDGNKPTESAGKKTKPQSQVIIEAFRDYEELSGSESARNDEELNGSESARNDESIAKNGKTDTYKLFYLGIVWSGNELLAASSKGILFLYDNVLKKVRWSIPTGKSLHVSYESSDENSYEYGSSIVFSGAPRIAYIHPKGSNDIKCPRILDFLLVSLLKKPYGYVEGDIVPSYSVTIIHVNPKTGQRLSPWTSDGIQKLKKAKTDSYIDEILCITRTDFELTCYKQETNIVLWYERIASFDVSIVRRDGGKLDDKNDVAATLLTKGISICDITWTATKDNVQLAKQKLPIDIISIQKGGSDYDAVNKEVTIVSLVSVGNLNVRKVYCVDCEQDIYKVSTEHCDEDLSTFIKSGNHDHKILLELISGIVKGLRGLHGKKIFLGNLDISDIFVDISDIFVDKMHYIAKISVFSEKTKFPLISSSEDATGKSYLDLIGCVNFSDDMRADMLALGHIIFFILAGIKYNKGDLTKPKPSNDNLKPIYGDLEALDLLKKLLHEVPALRPTALEVWNHPLLWDSSKKLQFIWTVSEHLETEDANSALSGAINKIGNTVFGGEWGIKVDVELRNAVEKGAHTKYNTEYSFMHYLIRFIRNLISHRTRITNVINGMQNVPTEVDEMFKTGEFGSYFFGKFPKLVMEVYNVIKEKCGEDIKFRVYFKAVC
ncbi:serine/threonine-protein kinase/endoribonuclease IRE1b-like protein isoform X2 [Tanacetum coccineum]